MPHDESHGGPVPGGLVLIKEDLDRVRAYVAELAEVLDEAAVHDRLVTIERGTWDRLYLPVLRVLQ